jgi:hypothetical protein
MSESLRHVIVYHDPQWFNAWPAIHGIWCWGQEILVGFERGHYVAKQREHSFDRSRPIRPVLARSLDGGETWSLEIADELAEPEEPKSCPGDVDFAHPDFALKCRNDQFYTSYDRGHKWQGPYQLPDFGKRLTSRTDYIVNGPGDCHLFLSAFEPRVEAGIQDRAFCVRTTDGGRSFQFLSWMTGEPITVRSVMPRTARLPDKRMVSALRRRLDVKTPEGTEQNVWIDVYHSADNGQSWKFLSKVADTGTANGNPPSLALLADGRLCVAYGFRGDPLGIRAKLSADGGATWGEEIVLRGDGRTWDLGYPQMVQRPDGKLVTVYYYTTSDRPEQHIAATIWEPDQVST